MFSTLPGDEQIIERIFIDPYNVTYFMFYTTVIIGGGVASFTVGVL
jgi:hypothetical protein